MRHVALTLFHVLSLFSHFMWFSANSAADEILKNTLLYHNTMLDLFHQCEQN